MAYLGKGARAWAEKSAPPPPERLRLGRPITATPADMARAREKVLDEYRGRLNALQGSSTVGELQAGNIAFIGSGGYSGAQYIPPPEYYQNQTPPWQIGGSTGALGSGSQIAAQLNKPDRTDEILAAVAALASEVADLRAEVRRLREGQVPEFTRLSDAYADES